MLDSVILNHAARILDAAARDNAPADRALRHYFLETRHLGPREKRAISRAVFAFFRWLQWLDSSASFQKRVEHAATLQERFNANEKSVKPETLAARAVPAWLRDEMDLPPDYLRHLQREPALWLRARPGTAAKLARSLGHCEPPPFSISDLGLGTANSDSSVPAAESRTPDWSTSGDALRFTGTQDLFVTSAFHDGAFEIQDLSSQLVGHACSPKPGETWWDACAGEGGKLLHLADLMGNKGVIWGTDRHERRLQILKRRATRAQLFNYRTAPWDGSARLPTKAKFDGILVDAPCSGVGTWQRNPHARWSTDREDAQQLAVTQLALLNRVAGSLKPGGRLIYSVCTLTRSETTAVAESFSAAHPDLEPAPLFGAPPESPNAQRFLWPHEVNANGMFIAAWRRR